MDTFVYYNLRKKCWSLRSGKDRKVYAHARLVRMIDVKPKVSEKGRQRVLANRVKNVHAGLQGSVVEHSNEPHPVDDFLGMEEITYNPYKYKTFVYVDDEQPFNGADFALLSGKSVWVPSRETDFDDEDL